MSQTRRNRREVFRAQFVERDRIVLLLRETPRTIPELATKLDAPPDEVLLWVMAMWRYGDVEETGKADSDGFFQYQLKEDRA
jgi:hypothetical protein